MYISSQRTKYEILKLSMSAFDGVIIKWLTFSTNFCKLAPQEGAIVRPDTQSIISPAKCNAS